ncbi:MAG: hypothetical protein L6R48_01205 [Planctomycetes bacterium]|nr:hypothetical protein [Planctomycetota bacterium]
MTTDQALAATAVLTLKDGEQRTFQIVTIGSARVGRIVKYQEPDGSAMTVSYRYAPTDDLGGSPARLWQINQVTDAFGRSATFVYGSQQQSGRWAVERIDFPGNQSVSYTYSGGMLAGATLANGDQATFVRGYSASAKCITVAYNDPAAKDEHRRKTAYLTTTYTRIADTGSVFPQSAQLLRMLVNGADEVSYLNFPHPWGTAPYIYEGAGRMYYDAFYMPGDLEHRRQFAKTWYIEQATPTSPVTYAHVKANWESTYGTDSYKAASAVREWYRGTPSKLVSPQGLALTVTYGTDGHLSQATYPDGTTSLVRYDQNQRMTLSVDRLKRAEAGTFDSQGNQLTKTVGLRWNSTTQLTETTADTATWTYTYTTVNGVARRASETDPRGNRTDFAYDALGQLASVTEPADQAGGPRAVTSYGYDGNGRVTQITAPGGTGTVTTQLAYDSRNRLTTKTYADGSTDQTVYGTGVDANLVAVEIDRNGNRTEHGYDGAGRRISTRRLPPTGATVLASTAWTYQPGTTLVDTKTVDGTLSTFQYDTRRRTTKETVAASASTTLLTQYAYDTKNRLQAVTDPYGRRTWRAYDSLQRPVRTVQELLPGTVAAPSDPTQCQTFLNGLARILTANPNYVITDRTLDAESQEVTATNGRGAVQSMAYDGRGRLVARTEATGMPEAGTTTFAFDGANNVIRATDARGTVTEYTYTGRNLRASQSVAVGTPVTATKTTTYTLSRKKATESDFRGNVTTFQYGTCCDRLVKVLDPLGYQTSFAYDFIGNSTSVTDANGIVGTTTYDGLNRVIAQTNGLGETTTYAYEANVVDGQGLEVANPAWIAGLNRGSGAGGLIIVATNPAGEVTVQVADGLGRELRRINGNGAAWTTAYDTVSSGLVEVRATDPVAATTVHRLDGASRARQQVDALGKVTARGFDADGNLVSHRDPLAIGFDAVFDLRNHEIGRTDTAGATTRRGYDAEGNVVSETDQLNRVQTTAFDVRNRKASETDRNGGVTQFAYDQDSNLLSITDAENKITTYVYDARSLLTQETFPAGQQTPGTTDRRSYTYDPGRRLASRTDQAGVVTTYQYDAANRLVARQYPDGLNDTYGYDTTGRLTSAVSARYGSTVRRFYTDNGEHAGRLTREEQVIGGTTYTVGYAYSADNQPTEVTYPDGTVLARTFTPRKELAQVAIGGGLVANRSYDDAGRLVATALGNGLTETRTYVPNDHLVAGIVTPGVAQFAYSYDAAKRKTAEDDGLDPQRNQAFSYDPAGRLTSWQRDGQESQNWQLSLVGDWQSITRNGVTETRTHSDVHETTSLTAAGVTTPLLYDQKGNLAQDQDGLVLTWDVENRLIQARDASNVILGSYSYDALGRRISKALGDGTVTIFVHDGARVVVEITGSIVKRFTHGTYIDEVLAFDVGAVRSFVSGNHLYSPTAVTSAAGTVVERFRYDAYGKQAVLAPDGTLRGAAVAGLGRGFTGFYYDVETALLYARSRYFSSKAGSYVSRNENSAGPGWGYVDLFEEGVELMYVDMLSKDGVYVDGMTMYLGGIGMFQTIDPTGAPDHHGYPLHLGGSNDQPLWDLTKEQHDAVHDYFRKEGMPKENPEKALEKWKGLSDAQREEHIRESLRKAGIPDSEIDKHMDEMKKGSNPNKKTERGKHSKKKIDGRKHAPPKPVAGAGVGTKVVRKVAGKALFVLNVYDVYDQGAKEQDSINDWLKDCMSSCYGDSSCEEKCRDSHKKQTVANSLQTVCRWAF